MFGILGQTNPAANTATPLYRANSDSVFRVFVSNTGTATTFNVYMLRDDDSLAGTSNAICYGTTIAANAVTTVAGLTLSAGQSVLVSSASGAVTFTACGEEQ